MMWRNQILPSGFHVSKVDSGTIYGTIYGDEGDKRKDLCFINAITEMNEAWKWSYLSRRQLGT